MSKHKFDRANLVAGVTAIALGLLVAFLGNKILNILLTLFGVYVLLFGIVRVYNKNYKIGIPAIVCGTFIVVCSWLVLDVVLLAIGVLLVAKGVQDLVVAIRHKVGKDVVSACVTLLCGITFVVSKWALVDALFFVCGAMLVAKGVLLLVKTR